MRLPKFKLFDYTTPGPGVEKDTPPKKGIALFFDILSRRFWKMVSLNAVYLLCSVPLLIIMWFAVYFVMSFMFGDLISSNTEIAQAFTQITTYLTCLLYALFGGGPACAGMTYVLRNYTVDKHSWLWADFSQKSKENFKQGTAVFFIDLVFITLTGLNFHFYGLLAQNSIIAYLLQGFMVVVFFIFLLMHAYVYPIMISFDMKLFDIYKNSFILAIGKLPRTFLSTALCTLICGTVTFLACFVTVYAMLLIPIIMFAFSAYVNLFVSYPVIQKYIVKK